MATYSICDRCGSPLSSPQQPLLVYVLFHETNSGHSEDSDGYVEVVYATKAAAEAARVAEIRKARDEGKAIWCDPDEPDDQEQPHDWTDDWTVMAFEVLS